MKIEVHSPTVRRREMDAVLTQLVEEKIGPGEQTQRFIQIAKEHLRFDGALALRSSVIALQLALRLMQARVTRTEERPPDAVLLSALSPRYYLQIISDMGLTPVICDVELSSACVSEAAIRAALERTGASLNVCCLLLHETLGFMPEFTAIAELGIPIIEDCSTAYGSALAETKAGSFGVFSMLGLEEHDMLTGGGGALLFARERRNAAVLRDYAELPEEYGLPDINAAMAAVQLRENARHVEKRAEIARLYTDAALRSGRHKLLSYPENFEYNNYAFPLALETGMKDVHAYAKKKDIAVGNAFAKTIAGAGLARQEECPNAMSLCLRTALFPLYPRLGQEAALRVAKLIQTLP